MQRQSGSVLDAYIASQANAGLPSTFGSNEPSFNSVAAANFGREYGTLVRPHPQYHQVADARSVHDRVEFVALCVWTTPQSCSFPAGLEVSHTIPVRQRHSTLLHGNKAREHPQQLKTHGHLHNLGKQCLAMAMKPSVHGSNSLPTCSRLLQQSKTHSYSSSR